MPFSKLKLTWSFALLTLPASSQQVPAGTISVELLRYPISNETRRMLQKAVQASETGDHSGAAKQLRHILIKSPGADAYVYSLLGVEYLKTGQITEAVDALQQAVALLPHDAANHANLGLALACKGQYDRAEPELARALELDRHNKVASQLLSSLPLTATK